MIAIGHGSALDGRVIGECAGHIMPVHAAQMSR